LIILRGDEVLVERRALHKATDPSIVVIPGGHVEEGETLEEACKRELKEELDLGCSEFRFLDRMLWKTPKKIRMSTTVYARVGAGCLKLWKQTK